MFSDTRFQEIRLAIACGEYSCLQQPGCCDEKVLERVQMLLTGATARDRALLVKMLCGCAVPTSATGGASNPNVAGSTCVARAQAWICDPANHATVGAIQTLLNAGAGVLPDALDPYVAGLAVLIEQMEEVCSGQSGTAHLDAADVVCQIAQTLQGIVDSALSSTLPSWILDPFKAAADKFAMANQMLDLCCPGWRDGTFTPGVRPSLGGADSSGTPSLPPDFSPPEPGTGEPTSPVPQLPSGTPTSLPTPASIPNDVVMS
jgi:hypothetical protein